MNEFIKWLIIILVALWLYDRFFKKQLILQSKGEQKIRYVESGARKIIQTPPPSGSQSLTER